MRRHTAQLLTLFALLAVFACDRVTPVAPVGSSITLSINPSRIDAEGEAAVITIIVRKEDGTPVNPGTQVSVSTTLGSLEPETTFTDETGTAKSTLSGDGRIGMATVSATTGAAALVSVELQIGSVAASITLTATPSNVPKDPKEEEGVIELLALIRDDTGAPLGGGVVNFAAETGILDSRGGPKVTNDLGEARDILTVSRNDISTLLDPFFLVSAETAIEGGSLILDELEIDIRGVPAILTLQATPGTVQKSDGGIVSLLAFVRDNLGDPLPDAIVNFQTDLGTLSSGGAGISTGPDGTVTDTLTLEPADLASFSPRSFQVRAQTAGIAGTLLEESGTIQIDTASPVANFTMSGTSGSVIVSFANLSTGQAPLSYEWDYNNDGTIDSLLEVPAAVTASAGVFTVKLTVKNDLDPVGDSIVKSVSLPFP